MKQFKIELIIRWAEAKEKGNEIECTKALKLLEMLDDDKWG